MARVSVKNLTKVFPGGETALDDLTVEVFDGEFLTLVGPSGCGKTTALRLIAGLDQISSGSVEIDGRIVNDLPPRDRDVAMVFQSYALYPHMTVRQNIAYSLEIRKLGKVEVRRRVEDAASMLGLVEYLDRRPSELSGGQRQRVAMGRAIVREPKAFLMDEPLSNLDAHMRTQMRSEIAELQRRLGVTTIYVTHDQVEAMTMGDRVAVLRDGSLQQVASPRVVYESPENVFVASFFGNPPMNLFLAEIREEEEHLSLNFGSQSIVVPNRVSEYFVLSPKIGTNIVVGIRPESLLFDGSSSTASIEAQVQLCENVGGTCLLHCFLEARPVPRQLVGNTYGRFRDKNGGVRRDPKCELLVTLPGHMVVSRGDRVTLRVKVSALTFFDAITGSKL
ncbi:MAG: ABC transporter ATP-binding protein [Actinomycetota bacterium]